jgi:anti-sigma regulatory factor (Ser/Thr protein kinase)
MTAPRRTNGVHVWHFAAESVAVSGARHHATRTLLSWGLDHLVADSELLVSELVTNAIAASGATDEDTGEGVDSRSVMIAVRLTCTTTSLIIEVWGPSGTPPVLPPPDLAAETGRGLLLVTTLSRRAAYYRTPGGGIAVWAELPNSPPRHAGSAPEPVRPQPPRDPTSEPRQPAKIRENLALLQRVADGLRALDGWYVPDAVRRVATEHDHHEPLPAVQHSIQESVHRP